MWKLAFFIILIGFGIKYAKMYYLIAGYNTMSKEEKAKIDIEGIASLFMTVTGIMAAVLIIASFIIDYFKVKEVESYVIAPTVLIGVFWLIIRSNSKKYRIDR